MLQRIIFLVLNLAPLSLYAFGVRDSIPLNGEWNYYLKNVPVTVPAEGTINLPDNLDNARLSIYTPPGNDTHSLRHEFSFEGEAVYSKNIVIPEEWYGKQIDLILERTKPSTVKVDGFTLGSNSRISSSQRYNLSNYLNPGPHNIQISINNLDSIPPIVRTGSHATALTRANWNGIMGNILLEAKNALHISEVLIDDRNAPEDINLKVILSDPLPNGFSINAVLNDSVEMENFIQTDSLNYDFNIKLDAGQLWSAYNPVLHDIDVRILDREGKEVDLLALKTGFRKFNASDKNFYINGRPLFLRGTVNAAVFPLTGYAPTDLDSWIQYFKIIKEYGLNFVRFHTWIPPEAAFRAADELGIYILVELPLWGESDRDLTVQNRFLKEELKGIMEAYAFHPSFVLFSPGNELWGDTSLMKEYKMEAKSLNPRILSSYGSNVYMGINGQMGEEDFILSSKTGHDEADAVRGSMSFVEFPSGGYINSHYPDSWFNYSVATEKLSVPVISHEIGQYQSYPDFTEIEDFTGTLKPDNFIELKNRALKSGTLSKAPQYHEASGKWAAKLYKAEMEAAYRTPGIAGFELFGLQDYPGQGSAMIGILNSFMESKGFVNPDDWKMSSSDIMILAEFPKFTFESDETIEIPLIGVNYSANPDSLSKIDWKTDFEQGNMNVTEISGVSVIGSFELTMPELTSPKKFDLSLSTPDTNVRNVYSFWVYPREMKEVNKIKSTSDISEAISWLKNGDKVILFVDSSANYSNTLDPLFVNDFWSYKLYNDLSKEMKRPASPGTLGLYIPKDHPAFKKFPTDNHTDWQWYSIIKSSRPIVIDSLPKEVNPLIEVIDNAERSHRLALMMEFNVDKGKMMIVSADLPQLQEYPEGRWFIQSIKEYMASKSFHPSITLSPRQISSLVLSPSDSY